MDRNQAIGLILITLLLIVYFRFFSQSPVTEPVSIPDTVTVTKTQPEKVPVISPQPEPDLAADSVGAVQREQRFGVFAQMMDGDEKDLIVENKVLRLTLNILLDLLALQMIL